MISHEVIINVIANTRTSSGLKIRAALDSGHYETGKRVSDEEKAAFIRFIKSLNGLPEKERIATIRARYGWEIQ